MLVRVIVMLFLLGTGVLISFFLQKRKPDPPSVPSYRAPQLLDREDFDYLEKENLVVVFASNKCNSCPEVWKVIQKLSSTVIGVQRVEVEEEPSLHERYRIDGVPTTLIVDKEGEVHFTFFGPVDQPEIVHAISQMVDGAG